MKSWIKNKVELAVTPLRKDVLDILEAGYDAIETKRAVTQELKWDKATRTLCVQNENVCFSDYNHIYLVAIGKCAVDAATAIEEILDDELTDGIVLDVRTGTFKKLKSRIGTHPLPSEKNVYATDEIMALLSNLSEKDLVLTVVSGGGSSLLCKPYKINCDELAEVEDKLMDAGADIRELNTVRKHLSQVQGGQLAKLAYPATVVGLYFSDVIGDDLSVIASGPFVKDTTAVDDAQAILDKHSLPNFELTETPKEDKYFEKVKNILLVNNERALKAMKSKAESLGYNAEIKATDLKGEAGEVGEKLSKEAMSPKTVYLYGGETTVTVKGQGKGGRNQELALGALMGIKENSVIISASSDGRDNTDVAGALADTLVLGKVRELDLDISQTLSQNDSYPFWQKVGGQISTGITGANVADFVIVLNA